MTRAASGNGERMHHAYVSTDVNFISHKFPDYKIGSKNVIIDTEDVDEAPSLKEIVAKETAILLDQQKRLSVRDLAKKFENGLASLDKLSDEEKYADIASFDQHVLLKKLRDALESLRGRVAGRNMDDADEAISMVEALAVQLTKREGELLLEKAEVKKLACFFKKAWEDAKQAVEEERALARAEIENARAAIKRVEQALHEQEISRTPEMQDFDELMKEVQEARRIKMLHQPSRVMDMEYELKELRAQLTEKSLLCVQLKKELEKNKRLENNRSGLYGIEGPEFLGSCLRIAPRTNADPDVDKCSIQWYRILPSNNKKELISGANKAVYVPEPLDVGRLLQVEIVLDEEKTTLSTTGPINPSAGLGSYVESIFRKTDNEFNVVVVQMNGQDHPSESVHVFHVGKLRIKLRKGRTTKAKESYSTSMLLCGVRGGGNAAVQSVFWQARRGLSFILAFETIRERNAAIMLARRYARDCNILLAGPDDRSSG